MSTHTAMLFGALVAFLFCAVLMLGTLMRYISSDTEGFRRWLDDRGTPA